MQIPGGGGGLPAGYTEVEYLTSDGGAYIDLQTIQFSAGDSIRSAIKFQYIGTNTNNVWFAGDGFNKGGVQYEYGYIGLQWHWENPIFQNDTITKSVTGTGVNALCAVDWEHTYESATGNYTFRIFQRSGFTPETDKRSVYYLKYYKNNVLLNDLVPCVRDSDSTPGMYDLVSGTFFTNAGSGTFSIPT